MNKRILSLVLSLALLLSAAGVCGVTTASAAAVTVTPATEVPAGSLLAGLRPVSGIQGQTELKCYGGTDAKNLTDGVFVDSAQNGRWMGWTSTGSRISFNLGAVAEVSQFLIGSEAGADQYADKVKIYVSETVCDPRTELYAEGNLVADVTGLKAAQNNLVTMSGAVKAIMIGFDFTGSTCNAYDTIRLGELGAYGTQNAVAADTKVTPITTIPTETNLLKTATATIGDSAGNDSRLTDDLLCTGGDTTWQCNTWRWGNQTWDLGDTYDIDKILIGSINSADLFVKFVNIYVSDSKTDLFTADSLVLAANSYYTGIGANQNNLLSSASGKAIKGRYVGFEFTNNSTYNAGHMLYFLRLGELGVYGTKAVKEYVTYNVNEVADNLPAASDNLLKSATAAYYRADVASGNSTSGDLTGKYLDGDVSTGSAMNSGGKNNGAKYIYYTYDLGEAKDIDSVLYFAQGVTGANSVAIYVGDKDLADVVGTTPDIFYNGAIGTNTSYMKNNVTDAVAIRFTRKMTGRYITFRLGIGNNGGWLMTWVGEFAAVESKPVAVAKGAQVRGTDNQGNTALRFGFDMTAAGVAYMDANPLASNNYARDLSNATVTVDGNEYTLVDFGAVVSLNADDELTLEEAATDTTGTIKTVVANNLYGIDGDKVTYTAVVTNIPASALGVAIYARPYVTYTDGTATHTVYGAALSRTVNGCTADAIG